jgi:hypothetical protein
MSLNVTGAKNFYYYGKPSNQIKETTLPPGQKIWTQLPANVAKIRIGAILFLTGQFFHAVIKNASHKKLVLACGYFWNDSGCIYCL